MQLSTVKNNLKTNTECTTMNFGIGDASVVIDILRNRLYEHKIRTLVQEYISNARDANREARNNKPIEITIPNSISPTFKVRDFGLGISPERMQNVFIMYGSSTKRGTNTQIGGFGIGAKSAWSYTDSFTIVTHIDGIKRTYVAHTGTSNSGRLDLVGQDETTEANGTEIQIAVNPKDMNEFKSAIIRATVLWTDKPIYKGIADQFNFDLKETVISSKLSIIPSFDGIINDKSYRYGENTKVILNIDGVPYELGSEFVRNVTGLEKLSQKIKQVIILKANNGDVEVSASRESIVDNTHNRLVLGTLATEQYERLNTYIGNKLTANSIKEIIANCVELQKKFSIPSVKHGKYTVNLDSWHHSISREEFKQIKICTYSLHRRGNLRRSDDVNDYVNLNDFDNFFILKGKETLVQQGRKIREYLKGGKNSIVVFNVMQPDPKYLTYGSTIVKEIENDLSLKDFANLPVPVAIKSTDLKVKVPYDKEEFCIHKLDSCGNWITERTTLFTNVQKWIYIPMKEGKLTKYGDNKYKLERFRDWLRTNRSILICGLAERSIKLVEKDSNFIAIDDFFKTLILTEKEKLNVKGGLQANRDQMERLFKVAATNVKDKFLSRMLLEYKILNTNNHSEYMQEWASKNDKDIKQFLTDDKALTKLIDEVYPLLKSIDCYNCASIATELELYVNMKYKLSNKK